MLVKNKSVDQNVYKNNTLLILIIVFGGLLRYNLFTTFPLFCSTLEHHSALSTPTTSYERLKEGVFLFQNKLPLYDGGIIHQSPLLLKLFSTIFTFFGSNESIVNLVYTFVDLLIAYFFYRIALIYSSNDKYIGYPSWVISATYLFNPLSVISILSRSTVLFDNFFIVVSIYYAIKGEIVAFVLLGVATHFNLYAICLLPALSILMNQNSKAKKSIFLSCLLYSTTVACLLLVARVVSGSWDYLSAVYGINFILQDLSPNIGLWWYFFIEMFEFFRNFFLCIFQIHIFIYIIPITINFSTQPLVAIVAILGLVSVFKPYPSIGDSLLFLSFLPIFRKIFSNSRYLFYCTLSLIVSIMLGVSFSHLWIELGSANSNFFYAITLVYSLTISIIIVDFIWVALRLDFDGFTTPPDKIVQL